MALSHLLPHSPFFNSFFSFLSFDGSSILLWIPILVFLVVFEEKGPPAGGKKFIIHFFLVILVTFVLSNFVLKNIFQRHRPATVSTLSQMVCPKNFSFPSTHAAVAFAAASVLAYHDKKRKWFYYAFAGLLAYSRIYLGCHYFLDVVTGGTCGILSSLIFLLRSSIKEH